MLIFFLQYFNVVRLNLVEHYSVPLLSYLPESKTCLNVRFHIWENWKFVTISTLKKLLRDNHYKCVSPLLWWVKQTSPTPNLAPHPCLPQATCPSFLPWCLRPFMKSMMALALAQPGTSSGRSSSPSCSPALGSSWFQGWGWNCPGTLQSSPPFSTKSAWFPLCFPSSHVVSPTYAPSHESPWLQAGVHSGSISVWRAGIEVQQAPAPGWYSLSSEMRVLPLPAFWVSKKLVLVLS